MVDFLYLLFVEEHSLISLSNYDLKAFYFYSLLIELIPGFISEIFGVPASNCENVGSSISAKHF